MRSSLDLLAAFDVRRGERVALVGGGGKTGLAYRLVEEARRRDWTALFTTTTKLLSPESGAAVFTVGEADGAVLRRRLAEDGILFLAAGWLDEWEDTPSGRQRKVGGFGSAEIEGLLNNLDADLALVEADGSRHRPFKAPADYEPVVPTGTTLLVVVAGLSVLGRPLDEAAVHRPEQVARLAGVAPGTVVDAALLAAVLAHPQGGLKGCPEGARAVAVLAQASEERLPAGRQAARLLLRTGRFERVVLVDLDDPRCPGEVWLPAADGSVQIGPVSWPRVQAVVLAAGRSQRMGRNKLLLPLGGKPVVAHAVDAALGSCAADVWVVLGAGGEALRAALAGKPVRFLRNRAWAAGQATSLRTALDDLPAWSEGMLFLAADMPFVSSAHLDRLLERCRSDGVVIWSGYAGRSMSSAGPVDVVRGIPALFRPPAFAALRELRGDVGGRALAGRFAEEVVPADFPLLDIDTAEDYEQACRWIEARVREHSPRAGVHGTGRP